MSSALTWIIHSEWRIRQCEERQVFARSLMSEMSEQGLDRNKGEDMRVEYEDIPKEIFELFDDCPPSSTSMLIGGILEQYYIECPGTAILASKEIQRAIKILSALANGEPLKEVTETSIAKHEPIQYRREGRTSYYILEETEEFSEAMEVIQKKLDVVYPPEDRHLGRCHQIWKLQKRLLMDWYGIEWYTPAERNPHVCYD